MAIKTFLIRSVGRAALTSPGATLFACDCSAAGEKHQLEFGWHEGFPRNFVRPSCAWEECKMAANRPPN